MVSIENMEVSTFLLLMFVPFFILLNYYGRSLRIRIMWFDNISVIFVLGCQESSGQNLSRIFYLVLLERDLSALIF
jgi:hypothetical protein